MTTQPRWGCDRYR